MSVGASAGRATGTDRRTPSGGCRPPRSRTDGSATPGSPPRTTASATAAAGGAVTTSVLGGRWRYAVLVADGVERVRAGPVERRVEDNMAVLDLGPSDWGGFETSSPR